jgi:outer membrane protein TolC
MRAIWFATFLVFFTAPARAESTPPTLEGWIAMAEDANPGLHAADARVEAAEYAADGAGTWPAPIVGYGWFLEPVQTRVGPQEHKLSITQALPIFGQNGMRSKAAGASAEAVASLRDAERDELRVRLTRLWNQLWLLDRLLEVAAEDLDLVEALENSALSQYRAGRSSQAAVVRIELERERAIDELRRQEAARVPLVAMINAELGRTPAAPVVGGDRLPDTDGVPSLQTLHLRLAMANRGLIAASRRSDAEASRSELASRERWPTLTLGADYIFTGEASQPGVDGSGQDAILLRAALRLPWPSGQAADRASRQRALHSAAAADEARMGLKLGAELEQAHFDYREAGLRLRLLEESLIPAADQALSVTRSSFAAGESTVGDLIEIRRTRLDLTREFVRVSADRADHHARLELLVGGSLAAENEED